MHVRKRSPLHRQILLVSLKFFNDLTGNRYLGTFHQAYPLGLNKIKNTTTKSNELDPKCLFLLKKKDENKLLSKWIKMIIYYQETRNKLRGPKKILQDNIGKTCKSTYGAFTSKNYIVTAK